MPVSPQDRKAFLQAAAASPQDTMVAIANSLAETREIQSEMLNAWGDFKKSHASGGGDFGALRAELQDVQQRVAMMDTDGVRIRGSFSGPSMGSQAASSLADDSAFQAAADAAARGMKPGKFGASVNLEGGIHAALVNEGYGDSSDTTMPTQPERAGIFGPVQRPLSLLQALPSRPVSTDAVEFVKLSASGDAQEQLKEGDEKSELQFSGQAERANIVTIAGWTPASKQVLADVSGLSQQINRVIRYKVLARLEHQLINGPGGDGRIDGLLHQAATLVPSISETPADRVGESMMAQADAGYTPNLILLNPRDWFRIQLTRKNATDDEYVFGSPTVPVPKSLWNAPIVTTPSIPEGTGMTLDTSWVTVLDREQTTVQVSNSHADFFTRNLVAILGELRAGLEVIDTFAVYKFDLNAAPVST
ncbi:MAG TPA: phage major capsid protein [Luteimonas sp.]|nr:phage major capsid protein [Luteimonas sp.]